MESGDVRQRESSRRGPRWFEPPRYTIDLSLPPGQRYRHVAIDFRERMQSLPILFDEILDQMLSSRYSKVAQRLARLCLRRVYSREETEELIGIQRVTSIHMHLLVAFNVLLDLFMGCTSGGVRTIGRDGATKMLHFRTLDWGMDPLRQVLVHLDYVKTTGGPVIASSITYAGYTGVLTGVRPGLSISLNFRPNHDASSRLASFHFYLHHLLVLIGLRPSISSLLRRCLLTEEGSHSSLKDLRSIEENLPACSSTAAYLIFSDGDRTITMEKDHTTALVRSAQDFIVATNHDAAEEDSGASPTDHASPSIPFVQTLETTGMMTLVEESTDRKRCVVDLWNKATRKGVKKGSGISLAGVKESAVAKWVDSFPITNEETHFACVMDPRIGQFLSVKCYREGVVQG